MTLEKYFKRDYIRHGEAVGIGILCEIYYASMRKNKIFFLVQDLLKNFSLPTNLNMDKVKNNKQVLQSSIYKNVFLDKKKVSQFPRYIKLTKLGKPKITEIKNFDQLNDTIFNIIFQ